MLRGEDDCDTFNYWEPEDIETLARELGADCAIETGYMHRDFSTALRHPVADGGA